MVFRAEAGRLPHSPTEKWLDVPRVENHPSRISTTSPRRCSRISLPLASPDGAPISRSFLALGSCLKKSHLAGPRRRCCSSTPMTRGDRENLFRREKPARADRMLGGTEPPGKKP